MLNDGASLDIAHAHSKEFEPDVWTAIAQHLLRPPTDPFMVDYKTGQGDLLSLVKASKAIYNATAPILYRHVVTHNPRSLAHGLEPDISIKGVISKRQLLAKVQHLQLECGDMSFRGTYLKLLANDLPTDRQEEIWLLVGEEVQHYTSYQYKPSEPKYMRRFLSRATIERARVQLVQWTLFWRFVVEKGGFKAVFPAVEHMSIGDDQGGFDPARRADLRWERLGTITGIEHASTLLAKALALSPVANVCVGACSIPSPMTPNRAILMARQADGKKCNLTVHIQTPPRPGEHQDDPLIKCPPFLVDGITTWECNTMTCGGDWVQMAIKFVSDAMGNAISLRKDIDRGRLAQRPLDIRIFLPRINMSTARPNFPGMPNMDQMDSFGLMMMSMGMQAQMNLAPGDMLGDALRVLSDRMVHLYTSSGVSNMKKVDMLDIDLGPA